MLAPSSGSSLPQLRSFLTIPGLPSVVNMRWLSTKNLCAWARVCKSHRAWLEAWLKVNDAWASVEKGYENALKLHILRNPRIIDASREGDSLLGVAVKCGRAHCVRRVLKMGADPNRSVIHIQQSVSPLFCATQLVNSAYRVDVIQSLKHWGARLFESERVIKVENADGTVEEHASEAAKVAEEAYRPVQTLHENYKTLKREHKRLTHLSESKAHLCFFDKEAPDDVQARFVEWLDRRSLAVFARVHKQHTLWFRSSCIEGAIEDGYTKVVKFLLRRRPSILNLRQNRSCFLLEEAINYGRIKTARLLLNAGAKHATLWKEYYTPNPKVTLGHVPGKHIEMMQSLLHWSADIEARDQDQTALAQAISCTENGDHTEYHLPTIRFLLENKANIHAPVKIDCDTTPLVFATRQGYIDILRIFLESHPTAISSTFKGKTLLMWAAAAGQVDTVRFLLEHPQDIEARDEDGYTALMHAVLSGAQERIAVIRTLLSRTPSADIKTRTNCGRGLINQHIYITGGRLLFLTGFIAWLVSQGAEIHPPPIDPEIPPERDEEHAMIFDNIQGFIEIGALFGCDALGRTMLMGAVQAQNVSAARLLLNHGVDIDAVDAQGLTALEYAKRCKGPNRRTILTLLLHKKFVLNIAAAKISLAATKPDSLAV